MPEKGETLPTIEELDRMDDLSGIALYSAELRRLPHYSHEEELRHIDLARMGDDDAKAALIDRCLPWLMKKATDIYVDEAPNHSDIMDLLGAAHIVKYALQVPYLIGATEQGFYINPALCVPVS